MQLRSNNRNGDRMMFKKILTMLIMMAVLSVPLTALAGKSLVVYSARKEHLIKPLFDAYTKETGIKIRYITAKAGVLFERLRFEGKNTRADLLITVDAGNLWHAAKAGLLSQVESSVLNANVPSYLRDPQNRWFGLSIRARTIVYNTDKVNLSELSTYEALSDPKWKSRLLLRTSKKVYNQSLVASFIAEYGQDKTEKIIRGWVGNLAAKPFSNDTKVMEAIAAGLGDVGIVNTYYFGRLKKKKPNLPLAIFWPNQKTNGVHVNISGAGITAHSKNKKEAQRLLEWLSSDKAQGVFAAVNMEYPVNPTVKPDSIVISWGEFKPNPINVAQYGRYQTDAIKLMDRAGYR